MTCSWGCDSVSWAAVCLLICHGGLWGGKCLTFLAKSHLAWDAMGWLLFPLLFGGALNVSMPSVCARNTSRVAEAVSTHFLPSVLCWRGCGGFWSVELSGTCREQSIAQLTVELCIQRLNSRPPLPFSSCLSSLWHSDTLPRCEEIYQGHTEMRAGSAGAQLSLAVPPSAGWQTLPSQAGTFFHAIVCLSWFFGSWDIFLPVLFHPRRG